MALPHPYYEHAGITIYNADCRLILPTLPKVDAVITDPPYNVGYDYASYSDNLSAEEYRVLIRETCRVPSVVIHYPEDMFAVAVALDSSPSKCAAWTYNANTPRKWRMVAWFGTKPDFSLMTQPYKNPSDRRIALKLDNGKQGCSLYDWWHEEQVKNVSLEKTAHPCQIPLEVMQKILAVTPSDQVIDPFMGSGTTLVAAQNLGRKCIGIEIEERYCAIAVERLRQQVLPLNEPLEGYKIERQGKLYGASTDTGNEGQNLSRQ